MLRCSLVLPDGLRVPIKASGVCIGRSVECDVGLDDEHISRRHAQLTPTADAVELLPLGRNPVAVNGVAHAAAVTLAHGDHVQIADQRFTVEIVADVAAAEPARWTIEHAGIWHAIARAGFTIGGADGDDLRVPGSADGAARLHPVQEGLFLEADDGEGVLLNGAPVAAGSVEPIGEGDRVAIGDVEFTAHRRSGAGVTPTRALVVFPERVELRLLARGGRLAMWFAGVERTLVVSERRLELLAVLLRPPAPLAAGAYVPDDVILQRVWPRSDRADHGDLNVLIHRLRRDLVRAGVNGPALIQRQAGGGGTRFAIHATTKIDVVDG